MAPLPIIADVFRVAIHWNQSGQSAVNVLHFLDSASDPDLVLTHVDTNVTAAMWGSVVTAASVSLLTCTPLDGTTATATKSVSGAKWSGGGAGDPTVAVAVLVSERTAFRGARARGRIYLPWTGESEMGNGIINSGRVATMQTAWDTFRTAMIAAGTQPVVASYVHSEEHPITKYTVEGPAATQRRRQDRVRG